MRALVLSAALLATSCGAARSVSLRFQAVETPDASVTVDDQYLGPLAAVAKRGVAVRPGKHRITIEKAGFFPFDREVEAVEQPVVVEVKLERVPE